MTVVKEMEFRYLVCSPHLNAHGTLHGGYILRWADESSGMHSRKLTGGVCVTRFIEKVNFISKAKLGDIILIKTRLISLGDTSLCFSIEIIEDVSKRKISSIDKIVFVSIDSSGLPKKHNLKIK